MGGSVRLLNQIQQMLQLFLHQNSSPPWALGVKVADIRDWAPRLYLQFSEVRRTCNHVARHVAGIALNFVENFF